MPSRASEPGSGKSVSSSSPLSGSLPYSTAWENRSPVVDSSLLDQAWLNYFGSHMIQGRAHD